MKFERLSPPSIPLPDLVAFNQRVHERVDPWFERRWVQRLRHVAGAALFALFAGMWLFFASRPPVVDKLLAYKPPLPTYVRGYDGDPVQSFARERRVELAYDEYPAGGGPRLHLGRGQDLLLAPRRIDYPGLIGAVSIMATKTSPAAAAPRADRRSPSRSPRAFCRTAATISAARSARRSSRSGSNRC